MNKIIKCITIFGMLSMLLVLNACGNQGTQVDVTESQKIEAFLVNYFEELSDLEDGLVGYEDDAKAFVAIEDLGMEKQDSEYVVYVWVFEESYFPVDETTISISHGYSIPCKVVLKVSDGGYEVVSTEMPGDTGDYGEEIEKLFPVKVQRRIDSMEDDGTIEKMVDSVEQRALAYFNAEEINYCPGCFSGDIDE